MIGYESFAVWERDGKRQGKGWYQLRSIDHVTTQERILSQPIRVTLAGARAQARVDGVELRIIEKEKT